MPTSWIKSEQLKEALIVLGITLALLLLVDYFLGYQILHNAPISTRNNAERGLGIRHPIYHHTLAANTMVLPVLTSKRNTVFAPTMGVLKAIATTSSMAKIMTSLF